MPKNLPLYTYAELPMLAKDAARVEISSCCLRLCAQYQGGSERHILKLLNSVWAIYEPNIKPALFTADGAMMPAGLTENMIWPVEVADDTTD